jgi:hypothetical protein
MNYLVRLKLADPAANPKGGIVFIEQRILPMRQLCKRLEGDKKIVAVGPLSGALALSLIVNVSPRSNATLLSPAYLSGRSWKRRSSRSPPSMCQCKRFRRGWIK